MENKKFIIVNIVLVIIILALLAGNIFLFIRSNTLEKTWNKVQTTSKIDSVRSEKNSKILTFAHLFIEKVLKAESPMDFETRLQIENAVRDIKDDEIMRQWKKFIDSRSEAEAQVETINLLQKLIDGINI